MNETAVTERVGGWIPDELMARIESNLRKAMTGVRDPEAMRQALERLDRLREKIYQQHGILDIGVPAIRELRDGE